MISELMYRRDTQICCWYLSCSWLQVMMLRHWELKSGDWSPPEIATRFNITGARGWGPHPAPGPDWSDRSHAVLRLAGAGSGIRFVFSSQFWIHVTENDRSLKDSREEGYNIFLRIYIFPKIKYIASRVKVNFTLLQLCNKQIPAIHI